MWPFLLDGRLVGRVDLKAERTQGALNVVGAFVEPGEQSSRVAVALAPELQTMASWLGLEKVTVGRRGDLAGDLRAAVSAGRGRDYEVSDLGEVFFDGSEVGAGLAPKLRDLATDRRELIVNLRELLPGLLSVSRHLLPKRVDCLASRIGLDFQCRDPQPRGTTR